MRRADVASRVGVDSFRAQGKSGGAARSSPGHSCIINRRSAVSTSAGFTSSNSLCF